MVAVVDAADAFHPASARGAGVQLERVLWVRPPGVAEAVRASERLLQARGFAAVLLDASVRDAEWQALPAAVWQRLTRAAAAGGAALIVVSLRRVTGIPRRSRARAPADPRALLRHPEPVRGPRDRGGDRRASAAAGRAAPAAVRCGPLAE